MPKPRKRTSLYRGPNLGAQTYETPSSPVGPPDSPEERDRVLRLLGTDYVTVTRGLVEADREDLIAQIQCCDSEFQDWTGGPRAAKWRDAARRNTLGDIKRLRRAHREAVAALARLRRKIDEVGSPAGLYGEDNVLFAKYLYRHHVPQQAKDVADALAKIAIPRSVPEFPEQPDTAADPRRQFALVAESFYLARPKCCRRRIDAHRRIALIFLRVWKFPLADDSIRSMIDDLRKTSGQSKS